MGDSPECPHYVARVVTATQGLSTRQQPARFRRFACGFQSADPSSHPEQFPTHEDQEKERKRLFAIIEELVKWENSTNEEVLEKARAEIRRSCGDVLPPIYDPFSGGCSIPLEAQRLTFRIVPRHWNTLPGEGIPQNCSTGVPATDRAAPIGELRNSKCKIDA